MSDANAIKGHGVRTVVEPSAMFLHRDAAFSKRVADESGLNVILALDWFTPEVEEQLKPAMAPNWSMTFLFEQVIPELKERGMTDEQLDQMMVENPKRWLA
jgi:predicted metal-dependent phosphotriesterase family hydrolase